MKKALPIIAGILLGLLNLAASIPVLFHLMPDPKFPAGTPVAMYMGALGPTGYMTMVKVFELLGGILVAIPRTRNWGLLILGPILVNILAFTIFITGGVGLFSPLLIAVVVFELYLLWVGRQKFAALLN